MALCHQAKLCLATVEQLLPLLASEFLALKEKNIDAIYDISEQKLALVQQLADQEKALLDCLPASDVPDRLSEVLTNECGSELAQQLITTMNALQQSNQLNGMLLQGMIRMNEQALNLLSGKADATTTYGASGQKQHVTSQLKLATA
jgi:flagellar biosynthesis/type III secretory pathway chaperone